MPNHGVYVYEQATTVGTPVVAKSGIPFVIGASPIQSADAPAAVGAPVLCTTFEEARDKLGYSKDWASYNLCEFMYSHFNLFGCQPVIFVNLLALDTMKAPVVAADKDVVNHKAELPLEAINDETLVVKPAGGAGTAYVKDEDYSVYYRAALLIEVLADGAVMLRLAERSITKQLLHRLMPLQLQLAWKRLNCA